MANKARMGGSYTTLTYRIPYKVLRSVSDAQVFFSNMSLNTDGTTKTSNDLISIKATFEAPNGSLHPLTFDGVRMPPLAMGMELASDIIRITLNAGEKFFVRVAPTVAIQHQQWPCGEAILPGTVAGGGGFFGDNVDSGSTTSFSAGWTPFQPSSIIGSPIQSERTGRRSILLSGDSIAAGANDFPAEDNGDLGGFCRAMTMLGISHIRACSGGIGLAAASSISSRAYHDAVIARCRPDYALCELGITDRNLSLSAWQELFTIWWDYLTSKKLPVIQTTLTPVSTSTDGWTTLTNQTPDISTTNRLRINSWIRTRPHANIHSVIDMASAVEHGNTGKWKVNEKRNNYTDDGVHATKLGHDLIRDISQHALAKL